GRGVGEKDYSERVAAEVDAEVSKIIDDAFRRGEDILKKHKGALDAIAKKLIEVETIERDEFEDLLIANGITPKKKDPRIDPTEELVVRG
ncbi:MAG TPA: cell division protein FtsH, partial [Candidatus Paceibacterota bacterium]|nr:cell division protein FtsH [Candidatus Paceibacterota bacterium]